MTNSGRPSFVGTRECKLNRRPKLRRRPHSPRFEMLSPNRGNTREAAIRPNRIRSSEQKTPSLASVARLKCLWFSSDVGFSRLSNFPEEVEPAISGRINPSKPARRQFYQGTARAGIKNGNYSESKALLLGIIAASLVLPPLDSFGNFRRICDRRPIDKQRPQSLNCLL